MACSKYRSNHGEWYFLAWQVTAWPPSRGTTPISKKQSRWQYTCHSQRSHPSPAGRTPVHLICYLSRVNSQLTDAFSTSRETDSLCVHYCMTRNNNEHIHFLLYNDEWRSMQAYSRLPFPLGELGCQWKLTGPQEVILWQHHCSIGFCWNLAHFFLDWIVVHTGLPKSSLSCAAQAWWSIQHITPVWRLPVSCRVDLKVLLNRL